MNRKNVGASLSATLAGVRSLRKRVGQAGTWRVSRSFTIPTISRSVAFVQEVNGSEVSAEIVANIDESTLTFNYNSPTQWAIIGLNATISANITGAYNISIDEEIVNGSAVFNGNTLYLRSDGENVLVLTFGATSVEVDAGFLSFDVPYVQIRTLFARILDSLDTEYILLNARELAGVWVPYLRDLYAQNAQLAAQYISDFRPFFLEFFNAVRTNPNLISAYNMLLPILQDPAVLAIAPELRIGKRR